MPDDHSDVVPLLPISNRTVKRVSADDSADSCVKVGHRQASIRTTPQGYTSGRFSLCARFRTTRSAGVIDHAVGYAGGIRFFQELNQSLDHRLHFTAGLAFVFLNVK